MSDKNNRPNIEGEMDEFQRLSQDLKRDEDIDVSVDEIINAFNKSKEETLTDDIWTNLENTESNEIEKGDWDSVMDIARTYKKTNPKKLKVSIEKGDYSRPLIVKLGNRYILVAGNTRLSTAAAMGVNPKVFIANIDVDSELNEKWSEKYKRSIDCNHPKGFSQRAHCQGMKKKKQEAKEQTTAASSGQYSGPAFGPVVKRTIKIDKINNSNMTEQEKEIDEVTDASSSGQYDVPAFGKTTKGGRRDPLKIDGPDSIYKGRAVTDKKFPKWGGPDSVFVKIKDKCKKFPYCNQGNTGAIEIIKEDEELRTIIQETSKKYGIPYEQLEKVVSNEISKIFI